MTAREGTDRLRVLVETGIAINSELSLDGVLERIVEAAARVTDATYAALGVIDRAGTGLERFVTHGMTAELERQIGDLPHGRGILGVLIHDARNLRLHDLSEHPRSVGFPPNHPPMHTFLGVPITVGAVITTPLATCGDASPPPMPPRLSRSARCRRPSLPRVAT